MDYRQNVFHNCLSLICIKNQKCRVSKMKLNVIPNLASIKETCRYIMFGSDAVTDFSELYGKQ